jgi:3-hydroxyisobutyrate dehydrogenase
MGGPMARNIARAAHDVRVWNRTREKAEPLAADGVEVADSPRDAVDGVEAVVTMLADAAAVENTMVAGGVLERMPADAVWIQMGTIGLAATARCAGLAGERDVAYVDAPVLGTRQPAEEGTLVVLASGPQGEHERCAPIFDAVGRKTIWVGDAGYGTRLKLVVNAWILCTIENLGETFALAESLDLDPRTFLEIIEDGSMDMAYAHLKGEMILKREFPPSFPLRHARKDLALVLEARDALELPLAEAALEQFDRALELGHGDADMAAVYFASAPASAGARR